MNISEAAATLGKKGGKIGGAKGGRSRSQSKVAASRANGRLGGRPASQKVEIGVILRMSAAVAERMDLRNGDVVDARGRTLVGVDLKFR